MKGVIKIDYKDYVLDLDAFVKIHEMLGKAEIYETKYHKATDTVESYVTHHVYPIPLATDTKHISVMDDTFYKKAKMAGAPVKE